MARQYRRRYNENPFKRSIVHRINVGNMDALIQRLAKISSRLLKRISEARRAKFDELRRTLPYVEANRASATKHMSLFQQPASFE